MKTLNPGKKLVWYTSRGEFNNDYLYTLLQPTKWFNPSNLYYWTRGPVDTAFFRVYLKRTLINTPQLGFTYPASGGVMPSWRIATRVATSGITKPFNNRTVFKLMKG